jgi:hypothetical protein
MHLFLVVIEVLTVSRITNRYITHFTAVSGYNLRISKNVILSQSGFSIQVDGDAWVRIQSIATDRHCREVRLY